MSSLNERVERKLEFYEEKDIREYVRKKTLDDFMFYLDMKPSKVFQYFAEEFDEHGCVDTYEDERWNEVLLEMSRAFGNLAIELEKIEDSYSDVPCGWNNIDEWSDEEDED